MEYQQHTYTDIIHNNRPNVLFLGNGLFYDDCNWDEFIEKCCRNSLDKSKWEQQKIFIPYSIRAGIACESNDIDRWNQYSTQLEDLKKQHQIYQHQHPLLPRLLEIPFDAILTTNYTYQIENCLDKKFVHRTDQYIAKHYSFCTRKIRDPKFLLHSFNQVGPHKIWHIHGEARRKSSIVLTHDEYGRLSADVRKWFQEASTKYTNFADHLKMETWMDYFMMGNVYVLGYAADFSEFVFWWMLGRRLRERAPVGAMYFYEPIKTIPSKNNLGKKFALEESNVYFESLGFEIKAESDDSSSTYYKFYDAAITDIETKIKTGGLTCQNL